MTEIVIPEALVKSATLERDSSQLEWIGRLHLIVPQLAAGWELTLGEPYQPGGHSAWVAPVRGWDGRELVLKVGWRHPEAEHEADGLRRWAGNGTVLLYDEWRSDDTVALLLERCTGRELSQLPESEQDTIVADLLRRLWLAPETSEPFRPLTEMCEQWVDAYDAYPHPEIDPGLERAGLELFLSIPTTATEERLLLTDLHAGNVLAAHREPWLVIDPKPYVGDPAYDPLQHLLNCPERLHADPDAMVARMADLCGVDRGRLRLWLFARCVVESAWWPGANALAARIAPS